MLLQAIKEVYEIAENDGDTAQTNHLIDSLAADEKLLTTLTKMLEKHKALMVNK